jgi:hypothetical protein
VKRLLFALLLLAPPAAAQQTEQVTVEKDRGLVGLWRVSVPKSIGIHGLFTPAEFGPMRNAYCRIEDDLAIHCLNGGYMREGTVTPDGGAVHIAWGMMMARFVIDANRSGDVLTGAFTFKLSGFSHRAPAPSVSERFTGGGEANAEATSLMARLRADRAPLPRAYDALGAIEHVAYLGPSPDLDGTGEADFFQVYAVEFFGGERLCGMRKTGILTCV